MKDLAPFISVVMCAYNTRPFIQQAVNSVLAQTYKNWELVIIDDCSTDGTREWLQTLQNNPQVRVILQEKNRGYVASKNFGISQAKGTYISQCDSDDYLHPQLLEKQVAAINANPGIDIFACGYYAVDMEGKIRKTIKPEKDVVIENNVSKYHPFWHPPTLTHRKVYEQIGYYTAYFLGLGDDMYWVTKANEHFKIYCLSDVGYYYRYNPNSITKHFDDTRKITRPIILQELLRQRRKTKTDWLEQEAFEKLEAFEKKLLDDKKLLSRKFNTWSRKSVDYQNWREAESLIKKAFATNPLNPGNWKSIVYYVRKRYVSSAS